MHRNIIAAGLLLTLAGWTGAQQVETEPQPQPCRVESSPPTAQDLPDDPLLRCATKALRGDFGKLAPWQAAAYRHYLTYGAEKRRVYLTQYGPWEFYNGASYHIAANPRYLPMGSIVWLSKPGALRVVTNRGAGYNDGIARENGCDHWVDLWTHWRGEYGLDTTTADAYVIRLGEHYRAGAWATTKN